MGQSGFGRFWFCFLGRWLGHWRQLGLGRCVQSWAHRLALANRVEAIRSKLAWRPRGKAEPVALLMGDASSGSSPTPGGRPTSGNFTCAGFGQGGNPGLAAGTAASAGAAFAGCRWDSGNRCRRRRRLRLFRSRSRSGHGHLGDLRLKRSRHGGGRSWKLRQFDGQFLNQSGPDRIRSDVIHPIRIHC